MAQRKQRAAQVPSCQCGLSDVVQLQDGEPELLLHFDGNEVALKIQHPFFLLWELLPLPSCALKKPNK